MKKILQFDTRIIKTFFINSNRFATKAQHIQQLQPEDKMWPRKLLETSPTKPICPVFFSVHTEVVTQIKILRIGPEQIWSTSSIPPNTPVWVHKAKAVEQVALMLWLIECSGLLKARPQNTEI